MTHIFDCALIFLADPIIVHKKRQDLLSYGFVFLSLHNCIETIFNPRHDSWETGKEKKALQRDFLSCVMMRSLFEIFWEFFCWFRNRDYNRRQTLRFVGIAWCMLIFMCNVMCNYHDHFLNLLIFSCSCLQLLCEKRNLGSAWIQIQYLQI